MQQQTLDQIVNVPVETHRQVPTIQNVEKTVEITEAQHFDKAIVEVPQIQSADQCLRVTSCSPDYAVRVLTGVRRGWRLQPVDNYSWTVLTNPLVQRVQMMTEVHQIQFIDESRRQRAQQTQRDVLSKEECPQAKLADSAAASKHSGTSTRISESSFASSPSCRTTMTVSNDVNKTATVLNNTLQFKILVHMLDRSENTRHHHSL